MWLELVLRLAEGMDVAWSRTTEFWATLDLFSWFYIARARIQEYRSHHLLLGGSVLFFFWPVVVTLVMALATASTWVFWLFTSIVFGLVQLVYVIYQFWMITLDIMALSGLKTYSMFRAQVLYYLGKSGLNERKSRRRAWRQKLDQAKNYEEFLNIPIESKDEPPTSRRPSLDQNGSSRKGTSKKQRTPPTSPSTPTRSGRRQVKRSSSFGDMSTTPSPQKEPTPLLTRNKSFDLRNNTMMEPEDAVQLQEELGMTGSMLLTTTARLREARIQASKDETEDSASSLQYLLSGVVKRNHLTVDDVLIEDARSVAESGKHSLSDEAHNVIQNYYEELEACLRHVAESPVCNDRPSISPRSGSNSAFGREESSLSRQGQSEIHDRISLARKMKQNMGRTALMLSGGGAQAMYHLGTIKALAESGIYDDIKVISGTSGGSITAAQCALSTTDELLKDVCVPNVSTDYKFTGEMKKKNIRWFPPVWDMGAYWLKNKLLVDSDEFIKCCEFYFGNYTFEEAFERTGKHVCITVSASRATGGTAQRLLLNHISTPHVTLSSAVAASCALPGVMAPRKLVAKDSHGNQEPFEVDGVEWIDGSVQADLPFQRISTLFNVSNYVVCQTNFHVMPFLNKAHHPGRRSFYWRLFQTLEWDIRNRALKLSRLGLFPRIFGQDISKVFRQRYHGNLTLVPRFTTMQTFGLKALVNPTVRDMEGYLKYGQIAAWPNLSVIQDMLRLEKAVDNCLAVLEERSRQLSPEIDWSHYDGDDIESIASSSRRDSVTGRVRVYGYKSMNGHEADQLKEKVKSQEEEIRALKRQLELMQHMVEQNGSTPKPTLEEKDVWRLVRGSFSKKQ